MDVPHAPRGDVPIVHDPATSTALPNTTAGCPLLQAYVDVFYIYVLGMGPVIITGFITNTINIVFLRRYFNENNSFLLLQFLSCTDLFFLLICFIYFPVRHLHVLATRGDEIMRRGDWEHGIPILSVVDPLFYLGQAARNWTIILITFERFVKIVYMQFAARHLTRMRLIIIWIVILVAASIQPIEKFCVMTFQDKVNPCTGDVDVVIRYKRGYVKSAHAWRYYYVLCVIIFPVVLLWIMNIALITTLRHKINDKAESEGIKSRRDLALEHQATRMVIAVLVVFTVLETPACVDRLVAIAGIKKNSQSFHFYQYWRKTALFLNVLHSALNFWAYCVSNEVYRGYFLEFVRRKRPDTATGKQRHEQLSETGNVQI